MNRTADVEHQPVVDERVACAARPGQVVMLGGWAAAPPSTEDGREGALPLSADTHWTSPCRTAMATACVRFAAPSLARTLVT